MTRPGFPRTRDARRREYQRIVRSLRREDPLATVTAVATALEQRRAGRSVSDTAATGVWLPTFALNAAATALREAAKAARRASRE